MRAFALFGIVPLMVLGTACAGKVAPSETTMSGDVALTSYPSAASAVLVRDEVGHAFRAALKADGHFDAMLPAGHQYKLTVVTANGEIPVVFPRANGKLDTSFAVRSRGAIIALGSVRHLPHAPAAGFRVSASGSTSTESDASCEDCADDNEEVSCQEGAHGQSGDQSGHDDANEDDDANDEADGNSELAIAEHNAPDDVAGCNDDGDDGNDNEGNEDGE